MPRIEDLEQRVALLDAELAAVQRDIRALRLSERPMAPAPPVRFVSPAPAAPAAGPAAAPAAGPAAPASVPRRGPAWEDLLAGRVMAWVGGSAVLVGLILFLALAISRGWIGEEGRTLLAGAASLLLAAGGARAYERRGRTEAALAATGAGVAGGFATLAVAAEVYGLLPATAGVAGGLVLGGAAAVLSLRWRSRTIAILGIGGALLSPVLAGADLDATVTIALLGCAYAGAAAVTTLLGWSWLGLLAFLLVTPQWALHLGGGESDLIVVSVFAVLSAAAVAGRRLNPTAHLLLALNGCAAAAGGYAVLWDAGSAGELWLVAVAAAHAAGGLAALRRDRRDLGIAALGMAVVLGDVAFADLVDGVALPLAWAVSAAALAVVARRESIAVLGLGGHLALAIGHVLTQEAPYGDLGAGGSAAGLAATLAIAASCLVSARVLEDRRRRMLDVLGLLAVAYATALAFDGAALAVAWSAEAAALGALARRGDPHARIGGLAFLAAAAGWALATVAPPVALAGGLDALGPAVPALAAVAAAAAALALPAASGAALVYLASTAVVTIVDGQAGQLALSALWCVTGLGLLLAGVLRDRGAVRTAGLSLLAVVTAKVFVVDLAALDSLARVGSFLVLGTLLLAGAFAWQRAKPTRAPDVESGT